MSYEVHVIGRGCQYSYQTEAQATEVAHGIHGFWCGAVTVEVHHRGKRILRIEEEPSALSAAVNGGE